MTLCRRWDSPSLLAARHVPPGWLRARLCGRTKAAPARSSTSRLPPAAAAEPAPASAAAATGLQQTGPQGLEKSSCLVRQARASACGCQQVVPARKLTLIRPSAGRPTCARSKQAGSTLPRTLNAGCSAVCLPASPACTACWMLALMLATIRTAGAAARFCRTAATKSASRSWCSLWYHPLSVLDAATTEQIAARAARSSNNTCSSRTRWLDLREDGTSVQAGSPRCQHGPLVQGSVPCCTCPWCRAPHGCCWPAITTGLTSVLLSIFVHGSCLAEGSLM